MPIPNALQNNQYSEQFPLILPSLLMPKTLNQEVPSVKCKWHNHEVLNNKVKSYTIISKISNVLISNG